MAERTNADLESFIQAKISEFLFFDRRVDSQPTTHLASVTNASDPRFPLAIDHTLLKQDATPAQIDVLCDEAIKYGFKVYTPLNFQCTADAPPTKFCFLGYHLVLNLLTISQLVVLRKWDLCQTSFRALESWKFTNYHLRCRRFSFGGRVS